VPRGWEIRERATEDLDGDNVMDAVLTLTLPPDVEEKLTDTDSTDFESAPNIVVVLLGRAGGGYRRLEVNGRLTPYENDYRSHLSPRIAKGVLILNDNWGDIWAKDITYRFRYDPAAGKMMLIGFDFETYSRSSIYEGNKLSQNYLTGVEIHYQKSVNRRTSSYSEVKRMPLARQKITFEAAHFNEDKGGDVTPY